MTQLNLYIQADKEAFDILYYVQMTANKYLLNGTYQELPAEWIHIKVEGVEEEVNAFISSLMNGVMKRHIKKSHREYKAAENLNDFAAIGRSMVLPEFLKEETNSWYSRILNIFNGPKRANPGNA